MVKTYKNKDDIPKTIKTTDGKTYYFYRTISDDADKKYTDTLEKKLSAWGYSLWEPITMVRTEMWAIYTDKKRLY
jgi:hypothetical protein